MTDFYKTKVKEKKRKDMYICKLRSKKKGKWKCQSCQVALDTATISLWLFDGLSV